MSNRIVVIGAICALVGCAAGVAARHEAVAQEAKPAVIRRWQQQCTTETADRILGLDPLNSMLRSRGAEGWELVLVDHGMVCFKRPLD